MDPEEGEGLREEVGEEVWDRGVGQEADLKGRGKGDGTRASIKGGGNPQVHFVAQVFHFEVSGQGVNERLVERRGLRVALQLPLLHLPPPG